jgi:hypothetical protein
VTLAGRAIGKGQHQQHSRRIRANGDAVTREVRAEGLGPKATGPPSIFAVVPPLLASYTKVC